MSGFQARVLIKFREVTGEISESRLKPHHLIFKPIDYMSNYSKFCTALVGLFVTIVPPVHAQIAVVASNASANQVALGGTYLQDFNTLPASGSLTWTDNSTLPGWYANLTNGQVSVGNMVATAPGTVSAVTTGAAGTGGTLNSLGASGSSNRAFGGTPSSYTTGSTAAQLSSSKSVNVVLRLKNSTGGVMTGMKVAYDTVASTTASSNAVALAYRIFSAGSGTISTNFIETHEYLNTYNGTYDESMRTEYGRRVSSTSGWTCVVKDIVPTSTSRTESNSYILKDLSLNPGDEIWIAWHIARENSGTTASAIDNVSLSDFTVGRPSLPVITTHPRSLAVANGLSRAFSLSVVAKGSSSLTYQWRKDGVNIAGATAATYTVASANGTSTYEGDYDVIVTSAAGSVTSLPAHVNLYTKVAITTVLDTSYSAYSSGNSALEAASGGTLCDLYYPTSLPTGTVKVPAVIVIHGGGGNNGDKSDTREVEAAQELAARGLFVMVINYAMSSSSVQCWPNNLWDAKQAVRWLKQKADAGTYKIDKTKIGVCGFSWGCNMASMLAMTGPADDVGVSTSTLKVEPPARGNSYDSYTTDVQCSAVFYGAADLPNYHQMNQFLSYTAWNNRTLYRRASPVRYPNANAAPMFVSHGSADDDVWQSQTESTYMMQRSQGAQLEPYLQVAGGQHSYGLYETGTSAKIQSGFPNPMDIRPETIGFFEKYLVETTRRPSILNEPVSQIKAAGATATFSVNAVGSPAPSYQWRRDGVNVADATSASLAVTTAAGTSGYYDVVVTNSVGSTTSTAAILSVEGDVTPVAPSAYADSATVNYNTATAISVLANDTDANGDVLSVTAVTQGAHGSVAINAATTVTYTPAADYVGADSFTYTISDGNGGTSTAVVNVTVLGNEAPDANTDTATTAYNLAKTLSVLANDTDINGDSLTITSVTQGAHGTVTVNSGVTVTYTPALNYAGVDSFTYTISDGKGGAATGTVNISVESSLTSVVSAEATVESSTNAGANIDETALGYVSTKYSATGTKRKAYFQFDLGSANVNATGSATFTIGFTNSYTQRVQLWALNQAYLDFSAMATWNGAQANDTVGNGMLTSGTYSATAIGASVMLQPGVSPYTPATFTIPNIGSYLKGGKVTLVLAGVDVTAADTTAGLANSSSGARYVRATASLAVPLNNGSNTPPTISAISNRSGISEDRSPSPITFSILDGQTDADGLILSVTTNHPERIPAENIVISGTGTNRTVQVTPLPNTFGTTHITITVTDVGGLTASESFDVTITAVNDAPTISDLADQSTRVSVSTQSIGFTVDDVDNAASTLIVSATSSDQTLVPDANLTLGGSEASRTITVAPIAGQVGTCTITVTVSDGTLSASDVFTITVDPAAVAPTLSDVGDQFLAVNASSGELPFTIGDVDSSISLLVVTASSSNQTLVPDANISLGGTDANRTVTVVPAANQSGTCTITVTVSDGTLSASDTWLVSFTATPRQSWWISNFGTADMTGGAGASSADPDHDGMANLIEYSQGGNPNASDSAQRQPVISRVGTDIVFTYRKVAPDLVYTVQETTALNVPSGWLSTSAQETDHGDGTYSVTIPKNQVKKFLRLKVEVP